MMLFRRITGFGSIFFAIASLNLLVLKEDLFVAPVYVPLMASMLCGAVWIVLRLTSVKGGTAYGLNAAVGTVIFLAICMILYAFVKRWDVSWDLTQEGRRKLSSQTVQVLKGLKEDVQVTCFFVRAGGDARVDIVQDKTERFLARCQKYTDRLKVEFVDPQQEPERLEALGVLRVSVVGTVVMRCGTRQREIPLSDVTVRLEERDFTNALMNVVRDSRPKVYFLTGHQEREIMDSDAQTGGSSFGLWLEREAYEVARHLIAITKPSIPEDCSVLVINRYKTDFHPHELQALDEYVNAGGRLLILTDAQMVKPSSIAQVEHLRPWLQKRFGIRIGSDIVVSPATDSSKVMFIPDFNDLSTLAEYAGTVQPGAAFRGSFNRTHPITRGLDQQMILAGIRTVALDEYLPTGVSGTVLLQSTPDTWAETDLVSASEKKPINPDAEEAKGPNPIAVAVTLVASRGDGTRGRDARLVVVGDADLASNEGIRYVVNQSFLLNSVAWLSENEELIGVRPTRADDVPIVLSDGQQRAIAWIASLGTVQVIALAGLAVFLARRKYR